MALRWGEVHCAPIFASVSLSVGNPTSRSALASSWGGAISPVLRVGSHRVGKRRRHLPCTSSSLPRSPLSLWLPKAFQLNKTPIHSTGDTKYPHGTGIGIRRRHAAWSSGRRLHAAWSGRRLHAAWSGRRRGHGARSCCMSRGYCAIHRLLRLVKVGEFLQRDGLAARQVGGRQIRIEVA